MSLTKTKAIAARIERHRPGHYGAGRREMRRSALALFDTALVTPPRMSGSAWAERYGRIPKGTGAESGPVTLYGYQRGLLDAMCDPTVPRVTVLKAARVGYTRCATLAIGYHLHHDPSLCAIAQPVKEDAEDFGGTEIAPMLRETPVLRRMMRPVRRGEKPDKATFFKLSNGASVRLVGAAADDAFRRYSAKFLFADEIDGDGWTPDFKSQGDKLSLFWTRGEKFWDRRLVVGSTPLLEETSRIAKLWAKSDQRRYFVPCRQCSEPRASSTAGSTSTGAARTCPTGSSGSATRPASSVDWYVGHLRLHHPGGRQGLDGRPRRVARHEPGRRPPRLPPVDRHVARRERGLARHRQGVARRPGRPGHAGAALRQPPPRPDLPGEPTGRRSRPASSWSAPRTTAPRCRPGSSS